MAIKVKQIGAYASLQDRGRHGYAHLAIPPSGALDFKALSYGNALLGNAINTCALECLSNGPVLEVQLPLIACIQGASINVKINGELVDMQKAQQLNTGDIIDMRDIRSGFASYLCVQGGFVADDVLESRSTLLSMKKGGFNGRLLVKDDILEVNQENKGEFSLVKRPEYSKIVRCFKGPEYQRLTDESIELLIQQFLITGQSNRMGFRLSGPQLSCNESHSIESGPVLPGTIQLPKNGQIIVLMNDGHKQGVMQELVKSWLRI